MYLTILCPDILQMPICSEITKTPKSFAFLFVGLSQTINIQKIRKVQWVEPSSESIWDFMDIVFGQWTKK